MADEDSKKTTAQDEISMGKDPNEMDASEESSVGKEHDAATDENAKQAHELEIVSQQIEKMGLSVDDEMEKALTRAITAEELYYLLGRYAYLELGKKDEAFMSTNVKFIKSASGWVIHDHGNLLTSSPGSLLFGERLSESEGGEGSGSSGTGTSWKGTVVWQYVTTAFDMMAIAAARWPEGAQIIRGFYSMKRAAWIAASRSEYLLEGFEPSVEDMVVLHWIEKLADKTSQPHKVLVP